MTSSRLVVACLALLIVMSGTVSPVLAADPASRPPGGATESDASGLGPNELVSNELAEEMIAAPSRPSRRTTFAIPERTAPEGSVSASTNTIDFTFRADPFDIRDLPVQDRPLYSETRISLVDTQPHDSTGVRMYVQNGVMYDHPVAQAQYALLLLNNYRLNGNAEYLARAELQAQRLIDKRVVSRNAWYYPYDFPSFTGIDLMKPPWYSAMAQGLALAVFVWLSEMTDDASYREAAAMTFNSFTNNRVSSGPWTVWVDSGGYLWLEEYPRAVPDQTINGSLFAAFGLYEYWRYAGDAQARKLVQGALTTFRHYLPSVATGWISYYCLEHKFRKAYYHLVVTGQLFHVYTITAHPDFADWYEQYVDEFPNYRFGGTVRFEPGTQTAYQIDANGTVTGSKSLTLSSRSYAHTSSRQTLYGRSGVWFLMSDGTFAGYYVLEKPGHSYIPGTFPQLVQYNPPRQIWLSPRTYTGYQFAGDGSITAKKSASIGQLTAVHASTRAVINGQTYRLIVDGALASYWIAVGGGSSPVLVDRLAGADRYATAAAISAASFDAQVPVAYLATGLDFPDALVSGPGAAVAGGPILLTRPEQLPAVTAQELTRLKPGRIVILGGTGAIGDEVAAQAATFTTSVVRIAGADRYATAAALSAATFKPGVAVAYLATGLDFPDALGGGAAAGARGGPVLLVKGNTIPAATAAELKRLQPGRITLLGSSAAVGDHVAAAAATYAPIVDRLGGADRYATAVSVSRSAFPATTTGHVFVAVGTAFPDGLAASAVAGRDRAPVLLVRGTSLAATVGAELRRLGPDRVTVLGATGAVSAAVLESIRALRP